MVFALPVRFRIVSPIPSPLNEKNLVKVEWSTFTWHLSSILGERIPDPKVPEMGFFGRPKSLEFAQISRS